jgi:anti-sigma factor RsiW
MNNHLSEEQFAQSFVGGATGEQRQHLLQCAECSAKLAAFGETVAWLRESIRETVDARVASTRECVVPIPAAARQSHSPRLQLALMTMVVLVVGLMPLLMKYPEWKTSHSTSAQVSADALMDSIDVHLSRTVPSPMEPIMSLIPNDEFINRTGGVQ